MNPINILKKWYLHLLMPFIEGTKKRIHLKSKDLEICLKKEKAV
tara:strand:+ start:101 stop:232 length:132 start_codon:yes stop_codon:yes gene_type:complete